MSWSEFLAYLSQPNGIQVVVGFLWSIVVEYWPWFGTLEVKWKRAVFFAVSLAVPLFAAALGVFTLGWPPGWEATFWPALVAGFLAFVSGTAIHVKTKMT